jgi:hypothetical protein
METPLLNSIFEQIRRNIKMGVKRSYTIYVKQGRNDYSNYTSIRRRFRSQSVSTLGPDINKTIPLSALQNYIKKHNIVKIQVTDLKQLVTNKHGLMHSKHYLKNLNYFQQCQWKISYGIISNPTYSCIRKRKPSDQKLDTN